jgi:TPR repeat protein
MYYERAANLGNPTGMFSFGLVLESGRGKEPNFGLAVEWYQRARSAGSQEAAVQLAGMMLKGHGFSRPDPAGAAALYQELARMGDHRAQYYLAVLYDQGLGVPKDPVQAKYYLEQSHQQGNDSATNDLATLYLEGRDGIRPAVDLGIQILKQAEGRGHPMSHYNLGLIFQEGRYGQARDEPAARKYFEFAAEHDIMLAQVKFGTILYREAKLEPNQEVKERKLRQAARYFEKAAGDEAQGPPAAQNNFATMLMKGEGVVRDYKRARMFLEWSARQRYPMAYVHLAEIVMKGLDGVRPNREQAIALLEKAQALGSTVADDQLRQMRR